MTGNLLALIGGLQKFVDDCDDSDKLYGLEGGVRDLAGKAENRSIELEDAAKGIQVGPNSEWFITKIRRAIEDSQSVADCDLASGMLCQLEDAVTDKIEELGPPT